MGEVIIAGVVMVTILGIACIAAFVINAESFEFTTAF